jgi:hypothetical protein
MTRVSNLTTNIISLSASAEADAQPLVTQEKVQEESDNLVAKILRNMNRQSNHESS